MCLHIPDGILREAGISDRDVLIEHACRLFDTDKLDKPAACRMCGLERVDFEAALRERGLPLIHSTEHDYRQDMQSIQQLRAVRTFPEDNGPGCK